MKSIVAAAAVAGSMIVGAQAALAFTVEGQQTTNPQGTTAPASGYVDFNPASVLPPIGQSVDGSKFDFSPSSFNNGMANQPTRNDSVGPSWLYPPR